MNFTFFLKGLVKYVGASTLVSSVRMRKEPDRKEWKRNWLRHSVTFQRM